MVPVTPTTSPPAAAIVVKSWTRPPRTPAISTIRPGRARRVLADQVTGGAVATQHEAGQRRLVEVGDGDAGLDDAARCAGR